MTEHTVATVGGTKNGADQSLAMTVGPLMDLTRVVD